MEEQVKEIPDFPDFAEIDTSQFLGEMDFDEMPDDLEDGADPDDDATPDSSDEIDQILNAANPIREGAKAIRKMGNQPPQTDGAEKSAPVEKKSGGKLQPKAMAKFYVATVDLALDKLCGFISKKPNGREFRLTDDERADYMDISTAFFEATNVQFSPTVAFGVVTALLLGGNVMSAFVQRKEGAKIVKMRSLAERAAAAPPVENEDGQLMADPIFAPLKGVRRKWMIDSNDRFCYNVAGNVYLKMGERREVCPADVLAYIRNYKAANGGAAPKDSLISKFKYGK